ncbi:MAG TPA: protein kinase [Terracidiphilus sp.]|nr:protein kinase [Terracidiphilus sp.]
MRTATIRAEWEGRLIDGRFPLLEWLGGSEDRGVFLTVLKGIQRAAIKLFLAEDEQADAHLAQWQTTKSLSHPHLAPVLEFGRCSIEGTELVFVVTELAERVLSQFIQDRPLKITEARDILEPTLDALDYLHEKGFVHGHIKPSNILIVGGELKISGDDFAVAAGVTEEIANPGVYDAPEVTTGNITPAADTWSIGMTFLEALMQRTPIWNRANGIEPIVPDTLPDPFLGIVLDCLRTNPGQRCSIGEIRSRLGSIAIAPVINEPIRHEEPMRHEPRQRAYEPDPIMAAADALLARDEEPVRQQPMGRARQAEPIAAPTLFSDIEETSSTRSPAIPLLIGSLLLLAFVVFLLVRADVIPPFWQSWISQGSSQKAQSPAPSQSQPAQNQAAPAQPPAQSATPSTDESQSMQGTSTPPQPSAKQPAASENQKASGAQAPEASQPAPSSQAAAPPENEAVPRHAAPRHSSQEPTGGVPSGGAVLSRVLPTVPASARDSMRGPLTVTVRVTANRSGAVEDASYVSPGPGNYFARIAVRAAHGWKFTPPNADGAHPQTSVWVLRFYFTRSKVDVTATQEGR